MGVNDRLFQAPAPDLAKINARLDRLPPSLAAMIRDAGNALATGDLRVAQSVLSRALALSRDQPDVLRLYGLLLARVGNLAAAVANFESAIRAAPDDAMGYWQYAQVCEEAGDVAGALRLREKAVQVLPDSPMAWADLGEHLSRHHETERALPIIERALALAPDYAPAQLKLGNTLLACGRTGEGAAAIRRAIAIEPAFGAAWLALVDIKTARVTDAEIVQMRELLGGTNISEGECTAIQFALGAAQEKRGRYPEAFELFSAGNARRKHEIGAWDARRFLDQARLTSQVFGARHSVAGDPQLGEEAMFIVGMPRSGTTLVEQVLAAHPQVNGAGELGELAQVLTEESSRLQRRFPEWVPGATPREWQRLGQRYLELTARYRDGHARFTDKMPNNWQALGAIRAMLPGARIVICRRDPVENCWSCFKQYFAHGWAFTCDFDHLGTFWKAFDHAATWWATHESEHIREQHYEALTETPETEIHALLEFCRLPFDEACLAPHDVRRNVHTLSAAQVREPVHRHRSTAASYEALLDPLRRALGLEPWDLQGARSRA